MPKALTAVIALAAVLMVCTSALVAFSDLWFRQGESTPAPRAVSPPLKSEAGAGGRLLGLDQAPRVIGPTQSRDRQRTVPSSTEVNWTAIGPNEIPNATGSVGLPASGKLQAFAEDPTNSDILYAGGGPGPGNSGPYPATGVIKSVDGGKSWSTADTGLSDPFVCAIWVDPNAPTVVVVGTWFGGIYRSTNAAGNWTLVYPTSHVTSLLYVNGTLYAATGYGVASSTDNGTTWSLIEPTASPASVLAYGDGTLVAGTDGGVVLAWPHMSGGWSTILTVAGYWVWSIAVNATDAANMYVVEFYNYNAPNLYETTDGGASWSVLSLPGGASAQFVALEPTPPTLLVGADGSLFASSDGGVNFALLPLAVDVRLIDPMSNGQIIVGSDQGLYDGRAGGVSWSAISAPANVSFLYGVAVHQGTILTSAQDFSPIASFNSGATWDQLWAGAPVCEGGTVSVNPLNSSRWYAYTGCGFQYSQDSGRTFRMNPTIAGGLVGPGQDLIAFDPKDPSVVYVGSANGVFESGDGGADFNHTSWPFVQVSAIAVSPASAQTIYVGLGSGSLYRSENGGTSWSLCSLSGQPSGAFPTTLAVNPANPTEVLVGLATAPSQGGGIWISSNSGSSFVADNRGIQSGPIGLWPNGAFTTALAFAPGSSVVAAATGNGVYLADGGGTWGRLAGNLATTLVTGLDWEGSILYASTAGDGVVRAGIDITGMFSHVTFTETGLPTGTLWSVTLNGVANSSSTGTIGFLEANGSYLFRIGTPSGYTASPSNGSVLVAGSPVNMSIAFAASRTATWTVNFLENGLSSGTPWSVEFNGNLQNSSGGTIAFTASNGSYAYSVGPVVGYVARPASGSLTVSGAPVTEPIAFAPSQGSATTYPVTFEESGLPGGTAWSVTVNGSSQSSSTSTDVFREVNATYSFSIGPVAGYSSNVTSGSVSIAGSGKTVYLEFTPATTGHLGPPPSGPGTNVWIVLAVVIALAVVAGIGVTLRRRQRRKSTQPVFQGKTERPPEST